MIEINNWKFDLRQSDWRAKRASVTDVSLVPDHGDPAEAVLAIAKREEADLMVIGRCEVGAILQRLPGSAVRGRDRSLMAMSLDRYREG